MKKTIKVQCITFLMVLSFTVNARSQRGIYMTAADFKNDKLSYAEGTKIHLNNSLMILPYVTVVEQGKKIKLSKNDVYGYLDNNKKVYRFCKHEEFEVAESGYVTIYIQNEKVSQSKGFKIKRNYYFSTTSSG